MATDMDKVRCAAIYRPDRLAAAEQCLIVGEHVGTPHRVESGHQWEDDTTSPDGPTLG